MHWRTKSARNSWICGPAPSQEYQRNLKTERVYQTGPVSRPDHRQIIRTIIKEFTA